MLELDGGRGRLESGYVLLLIECLITTAAIVSFVFIWAICGCCKRKKKKEPEVSKQEKEPTSAKKAVDVEAPTSKQETTPAATDRPPSVSPTASVPSEKNVPVEPIIPQILQEQGGPAYKSVVGTTDEHVYFEVGSRVKGADGTLKRMPPPAANVSGRAEGYQTLAVLDQQFESSTVGKKVNAAATLSPKGPVSMAPHQDTLSAVQQPKKPITQYVDAKGSLAPALTPEAKGRVGTIYAGPVPIPEAKGRPPGTMYVGPVPVPEAKGRPPGTIYAGPPVPEPKGRPATLYAGPPKQAGAPKGTGKAVQSMLA